MADPQPVQVPPVTGLSQTAAATALTREGLTVGAIIKASSDKAPVGHVIGSSPAAGVSVAPGTPVNLEVSSGQDQLTVPNVVGMTQTAAELALRSSGVVPGGATMVSSATTPKGHVSGANPSPGSRIAPGSAVDLEVSSGPDEVVVPNVTGSTQAAAESTLKSTRLVPGNVTAVSSATTPKGNVVAATPVPGTRVPAGSTINLEISSGPAQIAVPILIGLNRLAADAMLRSTGLLPGAVTTESSGVVPQGGVSSQHPLSGTLTSPGATVDIAISSGIRMGLVARIPAIGFTVLGVVLLGTIVWGLSNVEGGFLKSLADEKNARGLITFLIVLTTVGIALILALSTIVLDDSPENDKRFDRGKQVLTILIGVLGTIVGFYFGSATTNENTQQTAPQAQTLRISSESLPTGAADTAYQSRLQATGGTLPLTWEVSPALPDGLVLDQKSGVISGTPKGASRTNLAVTVTDGSSPPSSVGKPLTLEIK